MPTHYYTCPKCGKACEVLPDPASNSWVSDCCKVPLRPLSWTPTYSERQSVVELELWIRSAEKALVEMRRVVEMIKAAQAREVR